MSCPYLDNWSFRVQEVRGDLESKEWETQGHGWSAVEVWVMAWCLKSELEKYTLCGEATNWNHHSVVNLNVDFSSFGFETIDCHQTQICIVRWKTASPWSWYKFVSFCMLTIVPDKVLAIRQVMPIKNKQGQNVPGPANLDSLMFKRSMNQNFLLLWHRAVSSSIKSLESWGFLPIDVLW